MAETTGLDAIIFSELLDMSPKCEKSVWQERETFATGSRQSFSVTQERDSFQYPNQG